MFSTYLRLLRRGSTKSKLAQGESLLESRQMYKSERSYPYDNLPIEAPVLPCILDE